MIRRLANPRKSLHRPILLPEHREVAIPLIEIASKSPKVPEKRPHTARAAAAVYM
jgi:hypothetical protein